MTKLPSDMPLSFTNGSLQTQHREKIDLGLQNNSTVESRLDQQQDSQAWSLPPLGASESLVLVEPSPPDQDILQKSDNPELPQCERVSNNHSRHFPAKHFHHESPRACEPTCPDCPYSAAYLSINPVEDSFNSYTSRRCIAAAKGDMKVSSKKGLNEMRSRISEEIVGIGAQFWDYNDSRSCEPLAFPE
jgi:hypothetical protein